MSGLRGTGRPARGTGRVCGSTDPCRAGAEPACDSTWGHSRGLGGTCRRGKTRQGWAGVTAAAATWWVTSCPRRISAEEAPAARVTWNSSCCWWLRGPKDGKEPAARTQARGGTERGPPVQPAQGNHRWVPAGLRSRGGSQRVSSSRGGFPRAEGPAGGAHKPRTCRQGPCFEGWGDSGQKRPRGRSPGCPPGNNGRVKGGERHGGSSPDPRRNSRKGTLRPALLESFEAEG